MLRLRWKWSGFAGCWWHRVHFDALWCNSALEFLNVVFKFLGFIGTRHRSPGSCCSDRNTARGPFIARLLLATRLNCGYGCKSHSGLLLLSGGVFEVTFSGSDWWEFMAHKLMESVSGIINNNGECGASNVDLCKKQRQCTQMLCQAFQSVFRGDCFSNRQIVASREVILSSSNGDEQEKVTIRNISKWRTATELSEHGWDYTKDSLNKITTFEWMSPTSTVI